MSINYETTEWLRIANMGGGPIDQYLIGVSVLNPSSLPHRLAFSFNNYGEAYKAFKKVYFSSIDTNQWFAGVLFYQGRALMTKQSSSLYRKCAVPVGIPLQLC